jgi:hypothetical protein
MMMKNLLAILLVVALSGGAVLGQNKVQDVAHIQAVMLPSLNITVTDVQIGAVAPGAVKATIESTVDNNVQYCYIYVVATDLHKGDSWVSTNIMPVNTQVPVVVAMDNGNEYTDLTFAQVGDNLLPWTTTILPIVGQAPWAGPATEIGLFESGQSGVMNQGIDFDVEWTAPQGLPAGPYSGFVMVTMVLTPTY